jgi:hypothetical protein
MARKLGILVCAILIVAFAAPVVVTAAVKNPKTGWYEFSNSEVQSDQLFRRDFKSGRFVDDGYAAFMAKSMAASTVLAAQNAADRRNQKKWRRVALYSVVGTAPAYVFECSQAKAVGYVAAMNWALANGQPCPWGSASISEFLGGVYGVANFPDGPAFTLLYGPFCCFDGELDPLSGMGLHRGLLVNAGVIAAKGTVFGLTSATGYHGFFRVAEIYFHNALAWSGMTTIPANMLINAGYGLMGKGIGYCDLFAYQNSNLSTVDFTKLYGTNFGREYKAMSKFGQLVF